MKSSHDVFVEQGLISLQNNEKNGAYNSTIRAMGKYADQFKFTDPEIETLKTVLSYYIGNLEDFEMDSMLPFPVRIKLDQSKLLLEKFKKY